jgi:hypothetical protein
MKELIMCFKDTAFLFGENHIVKAELSTSNSTIP